MKKNGFTIVEILGVVVVLAVIMALLIPNLTNSSTKAKNKLYETKISMLEKAAVLYAQDNYNSLIEGSVNNIVTKTITSDALIGSGYYVEDSNGGEHREKLIDPRTNEPMVVNIQITINKVTKKITAKVIE